MYKLKIGQKVPAFDRRTGRSSKITRKTGNCLGINAYRWVMVELVKILFCFVLFSRQNQLGEDRGLMKLGRFMARGG